MGDFSRDTFDKMKHYVGVRLQQGVPLVDADWNEMEDIRKFELQAFIKWFVGDGVLNDGFCIEAIPDKNDDFVIKGGDGARCLVEGIDVIIDRDIRYQKQDLYKNEDLAKKWNVDVVRPLNPNRNMKDIVYLDVWEREVDSKENPELLLPGTKIETCVRLKREWAVQVAENTTTLPAHPEGHVFYLLASLVWSNTGNISNFKDERRKIGNDILLDEIIDARGTKSNIGNRLDESLTKGGELRQFVVGNYQVKAEAAIEEGKILFWNSGHDHSGGDKGTIITSNNITGIIPESKIDPTIARDAEVKERFDTTKGHDHNGNNSKRLSPSNLLDVSKNVTATNLNSLTESSLSDASSLHQHVRIPEKHKKYNVPLYPIILTSGFYTNHEARFYVGKNQKPKGIIPLNMPESAKIHTIIIYTSSTGNFDIDIILYRQTLMFDHEGGTTFNYRDQLTLIKTITITSQGKHKEDFVEPITINSDYKYLLFITVKKSAEVVYINPIFIYYTLDKLY